MEKTHLHKHCYSEWMYTCTYLTCVYFGEYLCRTSYVFKANLSSRNIHKMINIVNQRFILRLILCHKLILQNHYINIHNLSPILHNLEILPIIVCCSV